jgi:hypothetical protein
VALNLPRSGLVQQAPRVDRPPITPVHAARLSACHSGAALGFRKSQFRVRVLGYILPMSPHTRRYPVKINWLVPLLLELISP